MKTTSGTILLRGNALTGALLLYGGYGGGIYVGTARHDTGGPGSAAGLEKMFGPGILDIDDGLGASATPRRIIIDDNTATRWGGGISVGQTGHPPAWFVVRRRWYLSNSTAAINCGFNLDSAAVRAVGTPLTPDEMAAQMILVPVNMKTSYVNGKPTAVGLYGKESAGYLWGGVGFSPAIGRTIWLDP